MMQNTAEDLKQLEKCYFNKPIKESAVQLLGGGLTSATNYRLEHAGKVYVARIMPKTQLLVDREKECLIADYAGKLGVGPKVYYTNPQQGIIIAEFVQGRTARSDDLVNEPNRNLIIATVKRLHQADQLDFSRDKAVIAHTITAHTKRADSAIFQQQLRALDLAVSLDGLARCEADGSANTTLIHGDLNPNNILLGVNQAYLVDWTDAGIGDQFADLSWHAMLFPLESHNELLRYYFDDIDTFLCQKLCCYYCLRLFRMSAWSIQKAEILSEDCQHLLADIMEQQDLPDPCRLMTDIFSNKRELKTPDDFLLIAASMLHFLSDFTKTDVFLAAVEELSRHA